MINPSNGHTQIPSSHDSTITPVPNSKPKADEESALSGILHRTARNVIDVAAIETQGIEQNEYHDRARLYSNRANSVLSTTSRGRQYKLPVPNGVSAPQIVLASQPISTADVELISAAALKASQVMTQVKVEHKEDLVVPFGVS